MRWTLRRSGTCARRMRRLAREGTGLVLVTHHLGDILPEIERVILMRDGRIVGMGRARSC
jgi:ABC-type sugar transport system ATPase subunit